MGRREIGGKYSKIIIGVGYTRGKTGGRTRGRTGGEEERKGGVEIGRERVESNLE